MAAEIENGKNGGASQRRDTIRVAVVIVNYNGGDHLERCLCSLEQQDCHSYRVIVVDNHSSDDSVRSVERRHPRVQVIRLPENTGFAKANNVGIAAAQDCEWIACLNPDAFPEANWLSKMLQSAERYSDFSFFGCKLLQAGNPDKLDGTGDIYHVSGSAWRRDHLRSDAGNLHEGGEIFAPCAAAAMYRRDAILEVGGFDPSFFCYFEDVDLAFRLRLKGHRCCYVPEAVVHHVGSAITGYQSDFTVYHGHRNLVWTYFKNMPSLMLWCYLPQHILLNLASLLIYSFRRKSKVIFRAKWDAIKGLRRIFKDRKLIQAERRVSIRKLRNAMTGGLLTPYRR